MEELAKWRLKRLGSAMNNTVATLTARAIEYVRLPISINSNPIINNQAFASFPCSRGAPVDATMGNWFSCIAFYKTAW